MNFGQAIEALKAGKRVARAGWNGKGMWLALTPGSVIHASDARSGAASVYVEAERVDALAIGAHIDMRAADGTLVIGWLASQTDMLAADWEIVGADAASAPRDIVSHAQNPRVLARARDFYAVYCASSDGKNYQGLPCPAWDALTPAVRGHWYTVALRSLHLEAVADPGGVAAGVTLLGEEHKHAPNDYALGHLSDPAHALDVWREYSGQA